MFSRLLSVRVCHICVLACERSFLSPEYLDGVCFLIKSEKNDKEVGWTNESKERRRCF